MLNFVGTTFCAFGLRGSGKTQFMRWVLKQHTSHFVWDPTGHDYRGFNRYMPKNNSSDYELTECIRKFVLNKKRDLFVIEEANQICRPYPKPLPDIVKQLNDLCRHMRIGVGFVSRRPTQIHSDIVELSSNIFIFNLKGKNDEQYLDSLVRGLGEQVINLPPYHFVHLDQQRNVKICPPVPLVG